MGSKKNVDMSSTEDTVKIVKSQDAELATDANEVNDASEEITSDSDKKQVKKVAKKVRSKKYVSKRSQIDKTKKYTVEEAVVFIKKLSYSKFAGTITLDGMVRELGKVASITLPHSTGKTVNVAIADDEVLKNIEDGNIDFDFLITTPQFMPKLAKHARVLGPKGLMPNPKNGTVTTDPKAKKKELERGTFEIKTDKKQPVIHVSVGKTSMKDDELVANIQAVLKATKGKIVSATISASMSPSVKIEVEQKE
jgi:large subunit ribosomal protein L1